MSGSAKRTGSWLAAPSRTQHLVPARDRSATQLGVVAGDPDRDLDDSIPRFDPARGPLSVHRRAVGDAYDNALGRELRGSFKTELIKDRVWHSNTKLELAIVEYVAWFNTRRLHSSIGNRPPAEHEADWRSRLASQPNTLPPPLTLFTLNAATGVYDPSGVVSEVRCQRKLAGKE